MKRAWLPLLWALAMPAFADDGEVERAERNRIARERAQVQATFAQQQAECSTRFAVTACVDTARHEQRVALSHLRDQELALDAANRKQRAAERLSAIEAKTRSEPARAASASASASAAAPPAATARRDSASSAAATQRLAPVVRVKAPRDVPTPRPIAVPKAKVDRRELDARSRAAFEARQQEAAQRRQAVERRNAERAAKGKLAPGLPLPASGASR